MAMEVVAYEAPGWGVGELYLRSGVLVYHELPRAAAEPVPVPSQARHASPLHPLARRMVAFFAGKRVAFDDVELDLDWCTTFQRAVADVLREVSYGQTVTYGELAALAGHPNAQRAAGTFCAGNRFPLVLPCHRVIAAAGLGSYGSLGVDYKRRLLALEGHAAL
jgi:methylated-DNA-[protein]-cysteine S-methyltransferase